MNDEDKTFEQELNEVRQRKNAQINVVYKKDFKFVDVPQNIIDWFCCDVRQNYGNIYWVKLMDLMRKSEAYDMYVQQGMIPSLPELEQKEEQEIKTEDKGKYGIKTFGGMI